MLFWHIVCQKKGFAGHVGTSYIQTLSTTKSYEKYHTLCRVSMIDMSEHKSYIHVHIPYTFIKIENATEWERWERELCVHVSHVSPVPHTDIYLYCIVFIVLIDIQRKICSCTIFHIDYLRNINQFEIRMLLFMLNNELLSPVHPPPTCWCLIRFFDCEC